MTTSDFPILPESPKGSSPSMPWNSGVVTPRLVKTLASGDDFSNPQRTLPSGKPTKKRWKITILMAKPTISTGPLSIAMFVYQRV